MLQNLYDWLKTEEPKQDERLRELEIGLNMNPHTPDVLFLRRRQFHILFVYGRQQTGHPQHELVRDHGAYQAIGFTGRHFELWKKQLGKESFPILLEKAEWKRPDWATPKPAKVLGELYAIETKQLEALDKHFQNTLEFERKRVPIIVPYTNLHEIPKITSDLQDQINRSLGLEEKKTQVVTTEKKVSLVRAWMYIGKSAYWDDQLSHFFCPVQQYRPRTGWLQDYYWFTQREYDENFRTTDIDDSKKFSWNEWRGNDPKV